MDLLSTGNGRFRCLPWKHSIVFVQFGLAEIVSITLLFNVAII